MAEEEQQKTSVDARERKTLDFWRENNIFERSLEATEGGEPFVFYDGPPFATGLPHYGHLMQSILKDIMPRYQTMKGRYVRRVWGWDCHGLPIENLIEKELGLEQKKDIETYGVEKFNKAAETSVLRYDKEWKEIIPRAGRWIDMERSYKTMDWKYTESIWWGFKTLYDKGLIYEGYKPMHICPRCETTLAASEVTLNYKDIKDISVTVKFEMLEDDLSRSDEKNRAYVLAWTTTPWTLPGNVALAVGEDVPYIKAKGKKQNATGDDGKIYIVAKDRAADVFKDEEYEVLSEMKGSDLVGKSYLPVFDYYSSDKKLPKWKNGWKIYAADFVTTDTGTGVVHIAPAFGEDDMELGKEKNLPFVQHVKMDGTFAPEVKDFAGVPVKKKDDTQSTDVLVLKNLAARGLVFSKEKIEHSYPMCWRCDTPLLNYAASSWFVRVSAIRNELLEANKDILWVPETMRDGRFGKWLEGARDWAISRSRYWGAPIPVWKCESCSKIRVAGSVDSLLAGEKYRNRFLLMRHGEAESNVKNFVSNTPSAPVRLTENGRKQVLAAAKNLAKEKIDFVFVSDFVRTKETAEIVAKELGISSDKIFFDERLREIGTGGFDGKSIDEYHKFFTNPMERFVKRPEGGENIRDIKRRASDFLFATDAEYEGRTILVITHEYVVWMMDSISRGLSDAESLEMRQSSPGYAANASITEIAFRPFPAGEDGGIDLHRPYIDAVTLFCECGAPMKRVPEVFDCWFESGSMPYAQFHYPFENEELFRKNFPADFIAEAVDQTRGWFYNMLVLSVGLFGQSAFRSVVTTGLILAEDGQKMSKKLKNYPDPSDVVKKYGADALRYYIVSSPAVHGEDLNFSEKGVDEVFKKLVVRLENVLSFYSLYAEPSDAPVSFPKSGHILDEWIVARLGEIRVEVEEALERGEIDRAARPFSLFVDDLSTWYLQNSRERLKGKDGGDAESKSARATLRFVLREFSKLLAPFLPFFAEEAFGKTRAPSDAVSVHLEKWPSIETLEANPVLSMMKETRDFVSKGLEVRAKESIKVRQPLSKMTLPSDAKKLFSSPAGKEFLDLIAERVNVKSVVFGGDAVALDTAITPALREEGDLRDLIRVIQEFRKKENMNPSDRAKTLRITAPAEILSLVQKYSAEIKRSALFAEIETGEGEMKLEVK